MSNGLQIGILGDFNPDSRSHQATNAALEHAARRLGLPVASRWLATPSLLEPGVEGLLSACDGLWASPGSPYRSMEGMLRGIEFARKRDWPFVGTCGGFQHTLLEYARNVLGIADADSAEHGSDSKNIIISPVACALPNRPEGAPKLTGLAALRLEPGSRLHAVYQREEIREEYFCNYEVNPQYESQFQSAGLRVVARSQQGEARAVELPEHQFFLATLFQPQLSSTPENPHPVIVAYLRAVAMFRGYRV